MLSLTEAPRYKYGTNKMYNDLAKQKLNSKQ